MLMVDQYEYIRIAHRVYGKKIREIARETGHSRNTIKKALEGEHSGYKPRTHQTFPVLGSYLKFVDKWLEDDKQSPKKQRHTAVRGHLRDVGAADKAAIQLVKVQPCQLLVSDT